MSQNPLATVGGIQLPNVPMTVKGLKNYGVKGEMATHTAFEFSLSLQLHAGLINATISLISQLAMTQFSSIYAE